MRGEPLRLPWLRRLLWLPTVALAAGAAVPMLYALAWSLWGTDVPGILAKVPSLDWYREFARSSLWTNALVVSLAISTFVMLVATTFTIWAAYAARLGSNALRLGYTILAMMVASFPMLIYALGLRVLAAGSEESKWLALGVGYIVTLFPYLYFPLAAAAGRIPQAVLLSAFSLGASAGRTIAFVFIPMIARAIVVALALSFFLAWDELLMPLVLLDGSKLPISRHLWDLVGSGLEPYPAVAAVIIYFAIPATALLIAHIGRTILPRTRGPL